MQVIHHKLSQILFLILFAVGFVSPQLVQISKVFKDIGCACCSVQKQGCARCSQIGHASHTHTKKFSCHKPKPASTQRVVLKRAPCSKSADSVLTMHSEPVVLESVYSFFYTHSFAAYIVRTEQNFYFELISDFLKPPQAA